MRAAAAGPLLALVFVACMSRDAPPPSVYAPRTEPAQPATVVAPGAAAGPSDRLEEKAAGKADEWAAPAVEAVEGQKGLADGFGGLRQVESPEEPEPSPHPAAPPPPPPSLAADKSKARDAVPVAEPQAAPPSDDLEQEEADADGAEDRPAPRERRREADGEKLAKEEPPAARGPLSELGRLDQATADGDSRGAGRRAPVVDPLRFVPPPAFLPRFFYFENTYLGGDVAHAVRVRRLREALGPQWTPAADTHLPPQAIDAPEGAGLGLEARLDARGVDRAQRVMLQVGLRGSERYGWRRPPLDMVLVVDLSAQPAEVVFEGAAAFLEALGPQDRLGVVLCGAPERAEVLLEPLPVREARTRLANLPDAALEAPGAPALTVAAGLRRAADVLTRDRGTARVPGTGTVVLLTAAGPQEVAAASRAAHEMTVQGLVTSVFDGTPDQLWWPVAHAGHGNLFGLRRPDLAETARSEVASLARVVARLVRVNVRLAEGVHAIRVLGSRVLDAAEVREVKAREVATDKQLSATMGLTADRGDDDDGLQTVIPYFHGGDEHVVLIELWVERPGPVADVELRYKDMVRLENATARAHVALSAVPRGLTAAELEVRRNARAFVAAEHIATAAAWARRDPGRARQALQQAAAADDESRAAAEALEGLVRSAPAGSAQVREALLVVSRQRIGLPAPKR